MPRRVPVRPSRTPSDAVEPRIIAAAIELLSTAGDLTVRDVAENAGVSPMSVYNRFGGKQQLVDAVLNLCFRGLAEGLQLVEGATASERLKAGGMAFRNHAMSSPRLFQIMWTRSFEVSYERAAMPSQVAAFEAITELVKDCQVEGSVMAGDAEQLAANLWACVWGAVTLDVQFVLTGSDGPRGDYEQILDMLLQGLKPSQA